MLGAACTTTGQQNGNSFDTAADFDWRLPPGFAPPPVPESNPVSAAKLQLGRRLFYETRLSINDRGSCGSCHQQRLAFTDGQSRAIGATGELHPRSSMSLINVAYNGYYTWASRDVQTLEQQIRIPLFNQDPVELGLTGREEILLADLISDPGYALQFQQAFPDSAAPVSIDNIIKALATFVRSIIAADSAFDRLLYLDDQSALSDSAKRGMSLFYSNELKCSLCHEGQNLASGQAVPGAQLESEFHNTGLYNVGGSSRYPKHDPGLRAESGQSSEDGKFRAPSLRNIAVTAPYMHDGSIATLAEVIDHYAAGGRTIEEGPRAGIGSDNLAKSPLLGGFDLTTPEKRDLINFLKSLTDYSVLEDSRFSKPAVDFR